MNCCKTDQTVIHGSGRQEVSGTDRTAIWIQQRSVEQAVVKLLLGQSCEGIVKSQENQLKELR